MAVVAGCASSSEQDKKSLARSLREDSTLLVQLASFEESEQKAGIARIKKLGQAEGTGLVLYILQEPTLDNYRVEVVLARLLADWKDPRAVAYLLQSLRAPDDGAVRMAAEGLLVFRDNPRVLEALEEMLGSPARRERFTAADLLSQMQTPAAVEMLAARFRLESDKEIRALILLAVMATSHAARRDLLIEALADPDFAIRQEAWRCLQGYRDLPRLSFAADGPAEERAKAVAELRLWQKARVKSAKP